MRYYLLAFVVFALAAGLIMMVFRKNFSPYTSDSAENLLEDPAAVTAFAERLERAVRMDSVEWLAERTTGKVDDDERSKPVPGFPDAKQRRQRRIDGWAYWTELYQRFGHFDLLRQYTDEQGRHLIYRAFDGEKPVYTDLVLGESNDVLVLTDWTEQPGGLSEDQREQAFQELAARIGQDGLRLTVQTLVGAVGKAESGQPEQALADIVELPEAWRSNALVVGDQLRIMADAGDPDFPAAVLNSGGLLSAPAVAHLAFCWSLNAGDAGGLQQSTADLREQFGEDTLLLLYEGIAAQWSDSCERALRHFETVQAQFPRNPVLAVYSLDCLARQDPAAALDRLVAILPGTGFMLDELDAWLSEETPALFTSRVYRDWRLAASEGPY